MPIEQDSVDFFRETVEDYMPDSVWVMMRNTKTATVDPNDDDGGDTFGGIALNMGEVPGDVIDGYTLDGTENKCRLTVPRAQFNFAESTEQTNITLSRERMLLVTKAKILAHQPDGTEREIRLEDRLKHVSEETKKETIFEIMSLFPNSQRMAYHYMVQAVIQ